MNKPCFLAIDAGGTYLKGALFLERAILIENSFIKIPVNSMGNRREIKKSYQSVAKEESRYASLMGLTIRGIGICIPGPFDYKEGICKMRHKYASIYGIPLRPWFEEILGGTTVNFLHDSEAFLKGAIYQSKSDYNPVCGVILGTGLGFAIAKDNKVIRNPSGGPGISIFQKQYKEGTAEDYVSKRGILKRYRELEVKMAGKNAGADSGNAGADTGNAGTGGKNAGADTGNAGTGGSYSGTNKEEVLDIAIAAKNGDAAAIQVFNETGAHLAAILYDIIRDNEVEGLFLGGAISKSAELFLPSLKEGLCGTPLKFIQKAEDIDNAPLYGTISGEVF